MAGSYRWGRRRGWRNALIVIGAALVAGASALHQAPAGAALSGRVHVSDGDSLRLADRRIRLVGIDAPELAQTCLDRTGATWPCGAVARDRLAALVASDVVTCHPEGEDVYHRILARCTASGRDIGAEQVKAGMAVSYGGYLPEEAAAKAAGRGVWQGRFEMPRNYRSEANRADEPPFLTWLRQWFK